MLDAPSPRAEHALGGPAFSVAVHPDRSHVVVAPCGELDLATVDHLEREIARLRDAGFDDIILDLRGLTFLDSTGLRLLLDQARKARELQYRLRLIDGSAEARRLFEITGTRDAFEFAEPSRL